MRRPCSRNHRTKIPTDSGLHDDSVLRFTLGCPPTGAKSYNARHMHMRETWRKQASYIILHRPPHSLRDAARPYARNYRPRCCIRSLLLRRFNLRLTQRGYFRGYDSRVDATLANSAASAGLFFVAALTPKTLDLVDSRSALKSGERSLLSAFYAPQEFYEAGAIDRLIVGATGQLELPVAVENAWRGAILETRGGDVSRDSEIWRRSVVRNGCARKRAHISRRNIRHKSSGNLRSPTARLCSHNAIVTRDYPTAGISSCARVTSIMS